MCVCAGKRVMDDPDGIVGELRKASHGSDWDKDDDGSREKI